MSLNMKKIESGPTFFLQKRTTNSLKEVNDKKETRTFSQGKYGQTKSFVEKKYTE